MASPVMSFDPLDLASFHREWMVLLQCASAQSNSEKLAASLKSCDLNRLLLLAADHGMTGQLALALSSCEAATLPPDFVQALLVRRKTLAISALQMTSELFVLLQRFRTDRIPTVAVKGPVLSQRAYGDPSVRTYADLDLLVFQEDIRRATQCMLALGFDATVSLKAIEAGRIPGQHFFSKTTPRILVELHNDATLRYFPHQIPIHDFFDRHVNVSLDGQSVPALSAEDELVFVSVHGAKHFWQRLQWIADLAALISRQPSVIWDNVLLCAKQTGSLTMLNTGLLLASGLLGAKLPANIQSRADSDRSALHLVRSSLTWLPFAGAKSIALLDRTGYRLGMNGKLFSAPGYLLRLSLSPTEEDWKDERPGLQSFLRSVLGRPLRLMRKYTQR